MLLLQLNKKRKVVVVHVMDHAVNACKQLVDVFAIALAILAKQFVVHVKLQKNV